MDRNCSVLVLSCDKNEGLLNIFFDFYERNWPDCPFQTYLGIEKKKMSYKNVVTLYSNSDLWAKRVIEYLKYIKTENILIILDDFLLESKANTEQIKKYSGYLSENRNIATISLADIYDKNNYECEYKGLLRRKSNANYLLNLQVGLWNKAVLKRLLREDESPWQTELYGSIRARELKDYYFLCIKSDNESPYKYGRGWLMVRGAWNGNEIKRLKLERYYKDIFDGKDILFSEIEQIDLWNRIIRRVKISYRKMLSYLKIYI